MKVSTLRALRDGDIKNAIISETPGGIEAQEAQGQKGLINSSVLPKECNFCERWQLEKMGIIFGEEIDDLFIQAELPKGWIKEATNHSMYSDLLDEKGRKRASIFYKAAFYDREAFISLVRRFAFRVESVGCYSDDYNQNKLKKSHCVVLDSDKVVWESEVKLPPKPSYSNKEEWESWRESKIDLEKAGKDYLENNYPDYENPLAYWEN